MRQQYSGGFSLGTTYAYPVYVMLDPVSPTISAILNTGPSFDLPDEGYESWAVGPHVFAFVDGNALSIETFEPETIPSDVTIFISGFGMQSSTNYPDEVAIQVSGFTLTIGYGKAVCINWGVDTPGHGEFWTEVSRGVPDDWVREERTDSSSDGWTRIRSYA